jgi:hypothetical protein
MRQNFTNELKTLLGTFGAARQINNEGTISGKKSFYILIYELMSD